MNEPDTPARDDLVTGSPAHAREFYATVFGFTLESATFRDPFGAELSIIARP